MDLLGDTGSFQTLRLDGAYLQRLGTIYSKPIAYIILRGNKQRISSKISNETLHTFLFDAMPQVLTTEVRQGEGKRSSNLKKRDRTIPICKWSDSLLKRSAH